ncbi:late secretory pathway protein AVL9 homolog [Nilaparvata lugens]|uniref:late secretory pathway protein AVL9 homolog n=1 Tax=Nilaparvata lugens TaxID=108931 RepID=UPI00193D8907|nr:late secretory pathway protein AVL9 homolog [Nilaparvata lugens]
MDENDRNKSENPVLHVLVVGFHHKKGCQVEYSFPPLNPDGSDDSECPAGWKYLPTLALPDGSHNYEEDTAFFHLPSLSDPHRTVFGISCFRQIPVEKLKKRTADMTRGTVQKAVCVLSRVPLYGQIEVKMALITHAYFDEGDFSKVQLLADTFHHLNACISHKLNDHQDGCDSWDQGQAFVGLSVRDLVLHWRHKALLLFKLLLLERRVVFYKSPVRPLSATILTLLSLHPHMIQHGLYQSACIQPSRPMSPVPQFAAKQENNGEEESKQKEEEGEEEERSRRKRIGRRRAEEGEEEIDRTANMGEEESKREEGDGEQRKNMGERRTEEKEKEDEKSRRIGGEAEEEESGRRILGDEEEDGREVGGDERKTEVRKGERGGEGGEDGEREEELKRRLGDDGKNLEEEEEERRKEAEGEKEEKKGDLVEDVKRRMRVERGGENGFKAEKVKRNGFIEGVAATNGCKTEQGIGGMEECRGRSDKTVEITRETAVCDIAYVKFSRRAVTDDDAVGADDVCTDDVTCDVTIAALPRDVSCETLRDSSDVTAQTNMAAVASMDARGCGLPLAVFEKGYLCLPYLSLPYLDLLSDDNVRGYVVGATNVLFKQKKKLADVLVEVDGARIEVVTHPVATPQDLRRQLHLSTEDLRFADYLVRHVVGTPPQDTSGALKTPQDTGKEARTPQQDVFVDGVGWEGGDEWIRAQFHAYMLCLLRTSLLPDGSRELDHFNASFVSAFRRTHSYQQWMAELSGDTPSLWQLSPGHPFAGGSQLSVADMRLRISHTMQNTEGGRKLNQAMVSTGRAVATTGRAVGGAISQAKGALSSWWSNLTTAQSPTDGLTPGAFQEEGIIQPGGEKNDAPSLENNCQPGVDRNETSSFKNNCEPGGAKNGAPSPENDCQPGGDENDSLPLENGLKSADEEDKSRSNHTMTSSKILQV